MISLQLHGKLSHARDRMSQKETPISYPPFPLQEPCRQDNPQFPDQYVASCVLTKPNPVFLIARRSFPYATVFETAIIC